MTLDAPLVGLRFEVRANNESLGSFSECSGLRLEIGSEDYKEGGVNHFVHKLPSHIQTTPIVLKRGLDASTKLWDWIKTYPETCKIELRDLEIELNNSAGDTVRTWMVTKAYPLKWEGPSLNAIRGEVVFETLELAHQGVTAGKT